MDLIWNELTFGIPSSHDLGVVILRLVAAVFLGALIGLEREAAGKSAGLRTHMLVTLGTATLVLGGQRFGMNSDGLSRIIQGIITGIGFIGAGTILKSEHKHHVKGLTSAAGIWISAAIGAVVGIGAIGVAIIGTILALIILTITIAVDKWVDRQRSIRKNDQSPPSNMDQV